MLANLTTLISLCETQELGTILDAILLKDKALLSKWISEHPELHTPPIEPSPVPPKLRLSNGDSEKLRAMTLNLIRTTADGELGASLEDVIEGLIDLGYDREDIENAIEYLLEQSDIYEPFVGKIAAVTR